MEGVCHRSGSLFQTSLEEPAHEVEIRVCTAHVAGLVYSFSGWDGSAESVVIGCLVIQT